MFSVVKNKNFFFFLINNLKIYLFIILDCIIFFDGVLDRVLNLFWKRKVFKIFFYFKVILNDSNKGIDYR